MPLPASGPLTLSQIRNEFGGTNPVSMSGYYRGGAFVPVGTTGNNGVIPTSGTLAMSKFRGSSEINPGWLVQASAGSIANQVAGGLATQPAFFPARYVGSPQPVYSEALTGPFGNAGYVVRANEWFSFGISEAGLVPSEFTFDFWLKANATAVENGMSPAFTNSAWLFFAAFTWEHWAFTRTGGGLVKMFRNGVLQRSDIGVEYPDAVGIYGFAYDGYSGGDTVYFDELRYVKNYCQWNSNFTPPTAPY